MYTCFGSEWVKYRDEATVVNIVCSVHEEKKKVTVFGKTNRLARKSIIAYTWYQSFGHEDANRNKE